MQKQIWDEGIILSLCAFRSRFDQRLIVSFGLLTSLYYIIFVNLSLPISRNYKNRRWTRRILLLFDKFHEFVISWALRKTKK
jgi:hypothetical protein